MTGSYAGAAGSTIALDVNNTASGAIGGDQIVIKGASTSGTSSLALAQTGVLANKTFFATPILLIKGAPGRLHVGNDAATQATVAPTGLISYSLAETHRPIESRCLSLKTPATGSAAASQVASLIAGLNTSFFQATSGFISEPSNRRPTSSRAGRRLFRQWRRYDHEPELVERHSWSTAFEGRRRLRRLSGRHRRRHFQYQQ